MSSQLEEIFPDSKFHLITKKEDLTFEKLKILNPDKVFFPHWSYIIPREIFGQFECVIFHMTDLPYGRGGSPLQNLIVAGHIHTQISALKCEEEVDAGPVYLKKPLSLEGSAREIFSRTSQIVLEMIKEIISLDPKPVPQIGEVVNFQRRTPAQSLIPENGSLNEFYDYIRMLDAEGYPHAFLNYGNFRIEFTDSKLSDGAIEASVRITQVKL